MSCIIQKHVNILVQTTARGVCVWLWSLGSAFPAAGQAGLGPGAEQGAEDGNRQRLLGLCPEHCSDPRGSFQAAGSDPARVLVQQIQHRMEFVHGCDVKIVLLHHCLH